MWGCSIVKVMGESAQLADHGLEAPHVLSTSALDLAVVAGPAQAQTPVGMILGLGTAWISWTVTAVSQLGTFWLAGTHFIVLIHNDWAEVMGMQKEGFAHCFLTYPCLHPCRTQNRN